MAFRLVSDDLQCGDGRGDSRGGECGRSDVKIMGTGGGDFRTRSPGDSTGGSKGLGERGDPEYSGVAALEVGRGSPTTRTDDSETMRVIDEDARLWLIADRSE